MNDNGTHDNSPPAGDGPGLLTPGEVAALYRVDSKSVIRWAHAGKFSTIRTPGGHHRFFADEVFAALGRSATRQVRS